MARLHPDSRTMKFDIFGLLVLPKCQPLLGTGLATLQTYKVRAHLLLLLTMELMVVPTAVVSALALMMEVAEAYFRISIPTRKCLTKSTKRRCGPKLTWLQEE